MLYPVEGDGRPAAGHGCGRLLDANVPLVIPEDGCSVELVVQEPFGTDTVWLAASEAPLDLPRLLAAEGTRSDALVKGIRGQGLRGNLGYAECELEVVTKP